MMPREGGQGGRWSAERDGRPGRRSPPSERGAALVAVVVVLVLIAGATAATLWLTASDLWAAGRARSAAQARYTAEAAVYHALRLLAPGGSFAAVVAGRGGLIDAADPGPLPLFGGGWVSFPGPPFGYAVTVGRLADAGAGGATGRFERVLLFAGSTAPRGARHAMTATVGRAREPYAPAALVVTDGEVELFGDAVADTGPQESAAVVIDGGPSVEGLPAALAARAAESIERALQAITHAGGVVLGATTSALLRPVDLASYARETGLAARAPAGLESPLGTYGQPRAAWLGPGAAPGLTGYGAVVADGDLEIRGPIDFRGVVLVAGTLAIEAEPCVVRGMVWARALRLGSRCTIRYDDAAVVAADGVLRLPREAVLLALSDG
jgi:hypothetical protein